MLHEDTCHTWVLRWILILLFLLFNHIIPEWHRYVEVRAILLATDESPSWFSLCCCRLNVGPVNAWHDILTLLFIWTSKLSKTFVHKSVLVVLCPQILFISSLITIFWSVSGIKHLLLCAFLFWSVGVYIFFLYKCHIMSLSPSLCLDCVFYKANFPDNQTLKGRDYCSLYFTFSWMTKTSYCLSSWIGAVFTKFWYFLLCPVYLHDNLPSNILAVLQAFISVVYVISVTFCLPYLRRIRKCLFQTVEIYKTWSFVFLCVLCNCSASHVPLFLA